MPSKKRKPEHQVRDTLRQRQRRIETGDDPTPKLYRGTRGRAPIDMTGEVFESLTVIEPAESVNGRQYWRCRCVCGRKCVVRGTHLRRGSIRQCRVCAGR